MVVQIAVNALCYSGWHPTIRGEPGTTAQDSFQRVNSGSGFEQATGYIVFGRRRCLPQRGRRESFTGRRGEFDGGGVAIDRDPRDGDVIAAPPGDRPASARTKAKSGACEAAPRQRNHGR